MSFAVYKLADGADGAREVGRTSFKVLYLLQGEGTDTPIDAAGAMVADDIPRLGDSYGTTFPAALCMSISPSCLGNGLEWMITCTYATAATSSIPADGSSDPDDDAFIGGGFPEGYDPTDPNSGLTTIVDADGVTRTISAPGQDADPRKLPWQFELASQATMRERYQLKAVASDGTVGDYAKTGINTAGDPFGGVAMEDSFFPVVQLSKNVPNGFITPAQASAYEGSTNQYPCKLAGINVAARQGLITACRIRRAWWGDKMTPYWELALSIMICDSTELTDIFVLQRGFRQLVGGDPQQILAGNQPVSTPALLDAEGAVTTTPYYKRFARSNIVSWAGLKLPARV